MKIVMSVFIIVFGLTVMGCNDTGSEEGDGFIPTGDIIAVAERSGANQTIKVGGTPGAVPPGSIIEVTNLNTMESKPAVGQADGSFDPAFGGNTNDIFNILVTDGGAIVEETTIGVTLLSQAVRRDLAQLGSVPTAIEIRGNRAYVINGFFNNIQILDLDQSTPQEIGTIVLPQGSNPVSMAFLDDTMAYVANNIGQSVALVNLQSRQCEVLIVRAGEGGPMEPCQEIIIVSGTSFEDPSGIGVANGIVYVANNNILLTEQFEVAPLGPGFVTLINSETNQIVGSITASGASSTGVTTINDNVYVVNTGILEPDFSSCDFDFPPSIDVIDTQTNQIIQSIEIPLSEANPTVCSPGKLVATPDGRFGYLGLGLVGAILKVDLENNMVVRGPSNPIIITDTTGLNFTAGIAINQNGLGFITLFNTDQIAVIDTANDEVSPFPFSFFLPAGLKAENPNSDLFEGVQSLAIRTGTPGVNFQGADIFYITGITSKLGSVNTSEVLPPQ